MEFRLRREGLAASGGRVAHAKGPEPCGRREGRRATPRACAVCTRNLLPLGSQWNQPLGRAEHRGRGGVRGGGGVDQPHLVRARPLLVAEQVVRLADQVAAQERGDEAVGGGGGGRPGPRCGRACPRTSRRSARG
jgi:hypothetical protein